MSLLWIKDDTNIDGIDKHLKRIKKYKNKLQKILEMVLKIKF